MRKIQYSTLLKGSMLVIIALPWSAQAETQLKPGLWEYKMTMQMAGMPNMPGIPGLGGAPMTFTRCLTAEDTKNPERAFEDAKADHKCERVEFNNQGNKVSFKVRCAGDHPGTGSGEFTVAENHFEGQMKMTMADKRMGTMEMAQTMSGQRIGECKK